MKRQENSLSFYTDQNYLANVKIRIQMETFSTETQNN